jgi:hypothetical protein
MNVLLTLVLVAGLQAQGARSPIDMFYDPDGTAVARPAQVVEGRGLRTVPDLLPFPRYGSVGLHYWFENDAGERLIDVQAAASHAGLTLHVRGNTGGFLTVWSLDATSGAQMAGARLAPGTELVVPGRVEFRGGDATRRLILLFSRSETEQATEPANASRRFLTFSRRTADGRPQIVRGIDAETPGQVGMYVVNRVGGPVGAEISLASR